MKKNRITFLKISSKDGRIHEYSVKRFTIFLISLALVLGAYSVYSVSKRIMTYTGAFGKTALYDDPIVKKQIYLSNLEKETKSMDNYLDKMETQISNLNKQSKKLTKEKNRIENLMGIEKYTDTYLENINIKAGSYKELYQENQKLNNYYNRIIDKVSKNSSIALRVPSVKPCTSSAYLLRGFGQCKDPFTGKLLPHLGIDFAAPAGSPIYAMADGTVKNVYKDINFGNVIRINHFNGFETIYAHLAWTLVRNGDKVEKNQKIALMGESGRSSGVHLHYEILKKGKNVNPDRYLFFD